MSRLGKVVLTSGALLALQLANTTPFDLLTKHRPSNHEAGSSDLSIGEAATAAAEKILNEFHLITGEIVWAITEPDRELTTVLLPAEY